MERGRKGTIARPENATPFAKTPSPVCSMCTLTLRDSEMATLKNCATIGAIALLTILVIAVAVVYYTKDTWTKQRVEDFLGKNVSQGEAKEKVHNWITEMGWTFSHFSIVTDELDQWGGKTVAEYAKVDKREIASWSRVTIESDSQSTMWPKWGTIWPRRTVIYFLFDKDSKLIKYFCVEEQIMP